MRKHILVILAVLTLTSVHTYAQTASTQGKEFWVALIPSQAAGKISESNQEPTSSNNFEPYIAISAKKACTVKVSNPNSSPVWSKIVNVGNNGWVEIRDIPVEQWYPNGLPASEQTYNHGLKVEATENVSVFCALRWYASFDATNILPVTALQSEYIVQTYGPTSDSEGHHSSEFSVLAAQDCTVDIVPSKKTMKGNNANQIINVNLKAGQVYHVLSGTDLDLSGSTVMARDNKKIAVFAGCPLARIPNDRSARDLLYEQLFPTDYWGTEFITTRSCWKDANRIKITAKEDGTNITIYGNYYADNTSTATSKNMTRTINKGESLEFEMSAGPTITNQIEWQSSHTFEGACFTDSAVYIRTSCPCAVLSYDVGNAYRMHKSKGNVRTEEHIKDGSTDDDDYLGDPSMTWVSPIEQMINSIVFGLMGTNRTNKHFVNIVTSASNVANMTLNGRSISNRFHSVDGNPEYSYCRIKFSDTQDGVANPFYFLSSKGGFMATVYGNGDDESYAYSVGSAAVTRGIRVGGEVVSNGEQSNNSYCVGETITFDAEVGTTPVERVDWNFGDFTKLNGDKQFDYTFDSPGWYEVTARVYYAKDPCTGKDIDPQNITVRFRVDKSRKFINPDIEKDDCLYEPEPGYTLASYPLFRNDTTFVDCDTLITVKMRGIATQNPLAENLEDDDVVRWRGKDYTASGTYSDTIPEANYMGCDSIVSANITVHTCLKLDAQPENDTVCADDDELVLKFTINKGNLQEDAVFIVAGKDTIQLEVSLRENKFIVPLSSFPPDIYNCKLYIKDADCTHDFEQPLRFVVRYPSSVIRQKWDDVLVIPLDVINKYNIEGYQWMKDGKPIEGANGSWYYTGEDEKLDPDAEYSVVMTSTDGKSIETCPTDIKVQNTSAPATVSIHPTLLMPHETISVLAEGDCTAAIYSTIGVKEYDCSFSNEARIQAPARSGIYIMHVTMPDGTKQSMQIVVK